MITGTVNDGQTLTGSPGTWGGTPPFTYAYQWLRCDASGDNCADIPGETSGTYTVTTDDIGQTIRLRVTATNAAGSSSATSAATTEAEATKPSSSSPPTVSGSAIDGHTLSASKGSWDGTPPIDYAYRWLRCDKSGAGCAAITGATDSTYTLTSADVGHEIRVRVTASNAAGSSSADSDPTDPVDGIKPENTALPKITGTAETGKKLTASTGTWSGSTPITYAYQWKRCDKNGASCSPIAAATASTYTLADADADHAVRVSVTATNAGGSATATSDALVIASAVTGQGGSGGEAGGISLELVASPTTVSPGDPVTYKLKATNTTSTNRILDHLSLDLPDGFSYDQSSIQGGPTVAPVVSGGTLEWSGLVQVPAGGQKAITVGTGSALKPGTYYSGASASTGGLSIAPLQHTASVQVSSKPSMTLDVNREMATPGEKVTYTVYAKNDTGSAVTFDRLVDVLPSGFKYVSGSTVGYWHKDPTVSGQSLIWPISVRMSGDGGGVTIQFKATASASGSGEDDHVRIERSNTTLASRDGAVVYVDSHKALALKHRPFVMFDEGEPWRPLNVDKFLHEYYPKHKKESHQIGRWLVVGKAGLQKKYSDIYLLASHDGQDACKDPSDWGTCTPASAMKRVMSSDSYYGSSPMSYGNRFFVKVMGDRNAPNMNTCGNEPVGKRCDHNKGSRTAIYYHFTHQPNTANDYLDYWFFYRYNSPIWGGMDDHEGDWEHMIVNLGPPDPEDSTHCPTGIAWVGFAAHGPLYKYACNVLLWSGDKRVSNESSDATATQTHVDTYVAKGTHAMYPRPCFGSGDSCNQNTSHFGVTIEGGFDGRAPWGRNSKKQCTKGTPCVLPILDKEVEPDVYEPRYPYWMIWKGYWGVTWTDYEPFGTFKSPLGPYWQSYDKKTKTYTFEEPWNNVKPCHRTVFDNGNPGCEEKNNPKNPPQDEKVRVKMPNVVHKVWERDPDIVCEPSGKCTIIGEDDARAELTGETRGGDVVDRRYRFKVTPIYDNDLDVSNNHVIKTKPKAGKKLFKGDPVTVWISKGPKPVKMPDVKGMVWVSKKVNPDAKTKLTAKKYGYRFKVKAVKQPDPDVPNNHVIKTDPKPNAQTRMKAKVTVWVSKGPERVIMPKVKKKVWERNGFPSNGFPSCSPFMEEPDVKTLLTDKSCGYSFDVKKIKAWSKIANNHVIRTKPKGGDKTHKGASVTVWVSKGRKPVTVPDVTKKKLEKAKSMIRNVGLAIGDIHHPYNSNISSGHVIKTSPAKNSSAPKGDPVSIWVSKGPKPVKMPDVVGKVWSGSANPDVKELLTKDQYGYSFSVTKKEDNSSSISNNHVIRTDPKKNENTHKGASVTVWVSKGPKSVNVPDVTGKILDPAKSVLRSAGFVIGAITYSSSSGSIYSGCVIRTSPAKNTTAHKGDSVSIVVSNPPPYIPPQTDPTHPPW
jgi:uncharacterized repeat protein (TIGR01451 family)